MQTIGVKALKTNPGSLSKAFEDKRRVLITRRGEPIGVAAPFDEQLIELGFLRWIALHAFQDGEISLGQLARAFERSKQDMLPLLSTLGIAIADYDLDEDLEALRRLREE
jgi:predicted HTH domain antitoxin